MTVNIKKLFDCIAERINNPINVKLGVKAEVKEIPDFRLGTLLTLVLHNTTNKGYAGIDERIIDNADLYEQKIIEDEE